MTNRREQIIELLADELEDRLRRRQISAEGTAADSVSPPTRKEETAPPRPARVPAPEVRPEEEAAEPSLPKRPLGPPHAARMMARLALALVALVVAVNVPLNRFGTSLARMLPDSAAWAIVDGFVLKEEDDQEIYVFRDGQMRWISSIQAFEAYGYSWDEVHVAPDGFLDRFEIGPALEVLAKCPDSPHVYLLQGGEKRWIRDLETFASEGYVWEDVVTVTCYHLRSLPDGETIPPGSGPPPSP
jgi:hypothetical protein